jgi:acyl carrier protein
MKNELFKIMSETLNIPIDKLSEDSNTQNIDNWNSLSHINLIFALEEHFKVSFNDQQIIDSTSTVKLLSLLDSLCD